MTRSCVKEVVYDKDDDYEWGFGKCRCLGSLDAMSDQRYIRSEESYIHDIGSVYPDACTRNNEVDQGDDLHFPCKSIGRCRQMSRFQCPVLSNL